MGKMAQRKVKKLLSQEHQIAYSLGFVAGLNKAAGCKNITEVRKLAGDANIAAEQARQGTTEEPEQPST